MWCAMGLFGLALAGGTWLASIPPQPDSSDAQRASRAASNSNSNYTVASAPNNFDEIVASAKNSWRIDVATIECLSVSERLSSIFQQSHYDDPGIVKILEEKFPGKSINRKNDECRFALGFNIVKTTVRAVKYRGQPAAMLLSFSLCPRDPGGKILAIGCSSKDLYLFRTDLDPLEAFEIGIKAFDQKQDKAWVILKIPS
jgi:hypothetical protein